MNTTDLDDNQLYMLLKNSPSEGLRKMIELYSGSVNTICRSILYGFSEEDIDEAVSDSFVALWKSVKRFDPVKGCALKSYLYGIARHTALDRRKKQRKTVPPLPLDEAEIGQDIDLDFMEIQKINLNILRETLEELDSPEKEIFFYRYFLYEKIETIADTLSLSKSTVENKLHRGKVKLKHQLIKKGIVL